MILKIVLFTILGFALIILDLLFLPGGFLVVGGAALIFFSVYLNGKAYGAPSAIIHMLICIAITPKLIKWSLGRIALKKEMNKDDGYVGVEDHSDMIGCPGAAFSDLRPSGMVALDNHDDHLDCVAESGYIEKGSRVMIVEERGPSLIVRQIAEEQV